MRGRGGGRGRRPPPVNRGITRGPGADGSWQHPSMQQQPQAWQPNPGYPQMSFAPMTVPGVTLQPLPYHPGGYAPRQPGPGAGGLVWQDAGFGASTDPAFMQYRQQAGWQGQAPSNTGRGGPAGPRHAPSPRGRGGRGPQQGRGGRSGGRGQQQAAADQSPVGQAEPQASKGMKPGKLRKLAEMEATPKPSRPLTAAEIAEGARWQEERRKHFPSEENLTRKAQQAKEAEQGGAVNASADRQRRLSEILQLQRSMGIAKLAGTDGMFVGGGRGRFGNGPGRGRGGRFGRGGRGRGRWNQGGDVEFHRAPPQAAFASHAAVSSTAQHNEQPPADSRQQSGEAAADPLGLGLYGSDSDADAPAERQADAGLHKQAEPQLKTPESEKPLEKPIEREPPPELAAKGGEERKRVADNNGLQANGSGKRWKQDARPAAFQLPPRRPALLEKLLAKEIRQEHSYLLQCLRFFVQNGFLQDVETKALVFPAADGQADPLADLRASVGGGNSDEDSDD